MTAFKQEDIDLALKMRDQGIKWTEIEKATRKGILQAISYRRLRGYMTHKQGHFHCEGCKTLIHCRRYFCSACGRITPHGKSVR